MDVRTISDEIPEALRATYEVNLPAATFSVDDLVAGGQRRRRRRVVAAPLAGGAIAAAVVAGVVVAGSFGGDGARDARHRTVTPPVARTAGAVRTSCTTNMGECAWRVSQWAKDAGVPYADTARFTIDPDGGTRWEKGTWRLQAPLTSDNGGQRATAMAVTLSPSSTTLTDTPENWSGFTTRTLRLGDGEVATGHEHVSPTEVILRWLVPARPGVHPAVEVEFSARDELGGRAKLPAAATGAQVRSLLEILTGPGRTQVPTGTVDPVNGPEAGAGGSAPMPADPGPAVRSWVTAMGHPEALTGIHDQQVRNGWAVLPFKVGATEVTVQVFATLDVPHSAPFTTLRTPAGYTVELERAVVGTQIGQDFLLADERIASPSVHVTLLSNGAAAGARPTQADALALIDALRLVGPLAPPVRLSPPPAGASAAVVVDTYLHALVAGDCTTAHALATSTFKPGNGELCGQVKVSSFSLNPKPATPGSDEVIYGSVLTITEGSSDGTVPSGAITWFYDLKRQNGSWQLVGGGSGP